MFVDDLVVDTVSFPLTTQLNVAIQRPIVTTDLDYACMSIR
jgi:hypothetical protein